MDEAGRPLRIIITSGTVNDCTKADELVDGISARYLIADRGYDTNAIIENAVKANMEVVIPSKQNRKVQRNYNKDIYKQRHLVENAFAILKRWRGIATRYAKILNLFLLLSTSLALLLLLFAIDDIT